MTAELDRLRAALADRYEIDREIGAGGMATVYLATDLRHERQVALKVLRPDLAASLGPDRFLQEVRVTANLQHPHILPLFDSGEADGFLYYVMPFIDGESLRDRLDREGELPVPEAARLLRDVVDALATAHKAGVVHRDIKPENILLSGRHAMVADFGVAKAVTEATGRHRLTTMGVALGTPYYMSPEQAAADTNIDHRADIYAVGAMAYELLAGRPPFTGSSPQAVLTAQVTKAPDPVSEHRASVPAPLESMIMRCLEKKAADRWQSTAEMLPYLEAAATPSGGMTPTGLQPVTMATPPVGGVPKWALPVAAVVVVGAFGIWVMGQGGGAGVGAEAGSGAAAGAVGSASELDSLRVVIPPFENRTGDPTFDAWGELAAQGAIQRLSQGAVFLDVPNPARIRESGVGAETGPAEVAERFGAQYVVTGSYTLLGEQVRFDVDVADMVAGDVAVSPRSVSGAVGDVAAVIGEVAERAAAAVAGYTEPAQGGWTLRFYGPASTLESWRLFTSGRVAFCRSDYDGALASWEEAVRIDPDFNGPLIGIIPAYGNGGVGSASRDSMMALAGTRVGTMTQVERLWYAWLTSSGEEELAAALELEASMGTALAGVTYGIAFSAFRVNRLALAADRVVGLDFSDACVARWRPNWHLRTAIHHIGGDRDAEARFAREALEAFPSDPRMVAYAGFAAAARGDFGRVSELADRLESLPADAATVLLRLLDLGEDVETHGNEELAREIYARAHASALARLPVGAIARARAAYRALPSDEALPHLQQAVDAAPNGATVRAYLAMALGALGRAEDAAPLLAHVREAQPTYRYGVMFLAARGDGAGAAAELRRVLDAGGQFFNGPNLFLHHTPEFLNISADPTWQAMMAPRN